MSIPYSNALGAYLEPLVIDLWFIIRGRETPPQNIVIISIDEESYKKLGVSTLAPWPRILTAKLLEKLTEAKPKKILLDVVYGEETDPTIDQRLADAMRLSPTHIAYATRYSDRTALDGTVEDVELKLEPHALFKKSAAGLFFANITNPGIVRTFPQNVGNPYIIPMAKFLYGNDAPNYPHPTVDDYVNYYGPPGSVISIPFYKVLDTESSLPTEVFKDKYIFLGQQLFISYAARQTDTFMTPYHRYSAGVEIHATMAGNLLNQNWIRGFGAQNYLIFQLLISAGLAYLIVLLKPTSGGILLGVAMASWTLLSYIAFRSHYFIPGVVPVFIVMPLFYAFTCVRHYFRMRQLETAMGLKK